MIRASSASSEPLQSADPEAGNLALKRLMRQAASDCRMEVWAILLAGIGTVFAPIAWLSASTDITPAARMALAVCFTFTGVLGWGMCFRVYRPRRAATNALACMQDRKQVSVLIRMLELPHLRVRNLAKQGLIDLLPTLRAGDSALLKEEDRQILRQVLWVSPREIGGRVISELFSRSAYRREVDLRLAILKAFEQVGGEQEVATVEGVARGVSALISNFPPEIPEAAKACLPFLRQHAGEQRARAELLRASSSPTSADTLLRPATAVAETPPEQLLRPGDPSS